MTAWLKQWAKTRLGSTNLERAKILSACVRALAATLSKKRRMRVIPVADVEEALRSAGIGAGDAVLLHSATDVLASSGHEPTSGSFNAMAYAREILDMIVSLVGREGTIMMPTAPIASGYVISCQGQVFDYRKTPAGTGLIPNLFRKRPGVIRGLYPWQNVSVWGRRAEDIMRDHLRSAPYAMDSTSPWYRLNEVGGKVVLLGVDHSRSSTVHVLENTHPKEYPRPVFFDKPHRFAYISHTGSVEEVEMFLHAVRWQDGDINNFCKHVSAKYGIYSSQELHNTQVICFNASDQFDAFYREMENDVCLYDSRFWCDKRM